jgi:hypothetical protein
MYELFGIGEQHRGAFDEPLELRRVVVSFRCDDGAADVALAVVEAGDSGVSAKSFPLIDATKRLGNLDLDGVHVDPERLLGRPGGARDSIVRMLVAGSSRPAGLPPVRLL